MRLQPNSRLVRDARTSSDKVDTKWQIRVQGMPSPSERSTSVSSASFAPAKLAAEEAADNAARNNYSEKADSTPRAFVVRCLLALHGGKA